jgi:O-antigen/teichoic acid export membrane protein
MGSIASQSIKGVIWSAVERFSLQGVQFFIGIVLARLLSPSDFGMIGMLTIFLSISQIFVDCGFSNALIREKEVTDKDYGTAFSINFLISLGCFVILFFAAPFVADFYQLPELCPVMRVVSLSLVINALFTVHKAKLSRAVDFKTQSKASFGAALLSGILGVTLAYCGFGVWSLVWQTVLNSVLNLVIFSVLLRWFPKPCFNKDSFHSLFSFGSKLLVSSLIHSVYTNLYNIVIGKKFSAANLGFYTRADHLVAFPSQNVASILSRVTYPILSKLQEDNNKLLDVYKKYLQLACFVIFPLMIGFCVLAKPTVILLLGEKWLASVLLLQILCFPYMLDPVCNINLNLLYVKGRSDLVLKLEVIKKSVAVVILFSSIRFGLEGMCLGRALYGFIAMFLNMIYTRRFIDLSVWGQVKLLAPSFVLSLSMGGVIWLVMNLFSSNGLQLLTGILTGIAFYFAVAYLLKMTPLRLLLELKNRRHA